MNFKSMRSLSLKIVIAVAIVTILGVSITTYLQIRNNEQVFVSNLEAATANVNSTIGAALYTFMLKNDTESLDRVVAQTGAISTIKHVYVTDAGGKITRSSTKDIGTVVDASLLSRVKNSKAGIFELVTARDGSSHILSLCPIAAGKQCLDCHSDKKEGESLGYMGVDAWANDGLAQLATVRNASLMIGVVTILATVTVIFYVARSIFRPLVKIASTASQFAKGDLNHEIRHHSSDEIGILADSFRELKSYVEDARNAAEALGNGDLTVNVTPRSEHDALSRSIKNAILTQQKLVAETGKLSRAAVEGHLSARADASQFKGSYQELVQGMNDTLDAVIGPVNEAAAVLERLAAKDLCARVRGDYRGDLKKLKDALNTAAQNLDETLSQVALGAEQVASASEQISSGSQVLSQGAAEQASSLEEVSSSLQEMSSMTQQNAANAKEARSLSDGARVVAEAGMESMKRLSEAINKIQASSDATAKIVKTIDEIAFQTNLLALNAAVEAARAGDAGKGFAVVAEEVRNLAMRSAEAAKNTANLIEESVSNSEGGVAINQEVLKNLVEINGQVKKVSEVMAEIAAASEQQTQGVSQVNAAMERMNQVTQQTAANAEESASASEELAGQAQEMRSAVFTFRLSGEAQSKKSLDESKAHQPASQRRIATPQNKMHALASQTLHARRDNREKAARMIPFDDVQRGVLEEF